MSRRVPAGQHPHRGGHLSADDQHRVPKLAVRIRDDWQNCGVAQQLVTALIALARAYGITEIRNEWTAGNPAARTVLVKSGLTGRHLVNTFAAASLLLPVMQFPLQAAAPEEAWTVSGLQLVG